MKALMLGLTLLVLLMPASAQQGGERGLDNVLELVRDMPVEQSLRQATASALRDAVPAGRASPEVAYRYVSLARDLPPAEATSALQTLRAGLEGGLLVDRLMNEALKGDAMSLPWDQIGGVLELRLAFLLAARSEIGELQLGVEVCPQTLRQATLEVGWAASDHVLQQESPDDVAGMTSRAAERLVRLRGAAPCPDTVDAVLEALTHELVGQIAARALAQKEN